MAFRVMNFRDRLHEADSGIRSREFRPDYVLAVTEFSCAYKALGAKAQAASHVRAMFAEEREFVNRDRIRPGRKRIKSSRTLTWPCHNSKRVTYFIEISSKNQDMASVTQLSSIRDEENGGESLFVPMSRNNPVAASLIFQDVPLLGALSP